VSWSKAEMEELNKRMAVIAGVSPAQLFRAGEKVPDFRPG
jgi:hypothetical protein